MLVRRPIEEMSPRWGLGFVLALGVSLALVGCLEGDPNPTSSQGASGTGSSTSSGGNSSSSSGAPVPTVQPGAACSVQSTQAVNLPFRNAFEDRSVQIFWVDYQCRESLYRVLAPGETHVQTTYVSHPWRVRDAVTGALYKEVVPTTTAPPEVVVP